jgi:predicted transcriptional regulator of viral defense system
MRRRMQLTDREWKWLWEYTRTGSNASQAARIAYGGTPISVRVKGHKKKVKLKPILDKILDKWNDQTKDVDQIEREVDAYLKRLKRRTRRSL